MLEFHLPVWTTKILPYSLNSKLSHEAVAGIKCISAAIPCLSFPCRSDGVGLGIPCLSFPSVVIGLPG